MASKGVKLIAVSTFALVAFAAVGFQAYRAYFSDGGNPPGNYPTRIVQIETKLNGHTDGILALAFTPDSKFLISGSADHSILLWDVEKKEKVKELGGHDASVIALALSADGKRLLSGDKDHKIVLRTFPDNQITESQEQICAVTHLAFLPDEKSFVSVCGNRLRVWEIGKADNDVFHVTPRQIYALAVTAAGEVITGDGGGNLIVWDPLTGRKLQEHRRPMADQPWKNEPARSNFIAGILVRPNGHVLVSDITGIWEWDRKADTITLISQSQMQLRDLVPGDRLMASISMNGWHVREISPKGTQVGATITFAHTAIASPDGQYLAVASGGNFTPDGLEWIPGGPSPVTLIWMQEIIDSIGREKQRYASDPSLVDRMAVNPALPAPLPWK